MDTLSAGRPRRAADLVKLRAWWSHRQGLDGSLAGAGPAEVLARAGWARSVGGPGPYLGLFARAGLSRATVDKAVADLGIHELPAARGRTYVLPAADFTLGLRVGEAEAEAGMAAVARDFVETGPRSRAGLTASIEAGTAIEAVSAAVVAVLEAADRPLDPAALEAATGEAVRNLGEAGREPGSATLLPLALARLQARGEILRMRTNGRLDQRRYRYVRWDRYTGGQSAEEAQAHLARRYFDWAAPASLTHFRWFSGLTSVAAEAAVAGLDLRLLPGTELLIPVGLAGRFARFEVPRRPWYALVADTDGIHLLHREFGLLLDEADAARPAPGDPRARTLGGLADPPAHMITDRGRLIGLWEYDAGARRIVWEAYVRPDARLKQAVAATESFVREELGGTGGNGLDSPGLASRVTALRDAGTAAAAP